MSESAAKRWLDDRRVSLRPETCKMIGRMAEAKSANGVIDLAEMR